MKGNHSEPKRAALAVLKEGQISTAVLISKLQAVALQQIAEIKSMERGSAIRGVLVGLTLHRIKAGLAHGDWMPWLKKSLKGAGHRQANYYMRLATTFIAAAKVSKPELLALPGDQAELSLEPADATARHFMDKVGKFVGECSLNELLDKHHIKGSGKLGGKHESDDDAPEPVIDPEQLAEQAREELAAWHEAGRQLLLTENICSRLSQDEIRNFSSSLDAMLAQWHRGLGKILKASS